MKKPDSLQRFIFEHATIRGELVHIEDTFQTIIGQRAYPPMVKHLLGEALVSCLLLANSIKFEGSLHLQFQGDARLPLLLVQCDQDLQVRAYAKYTDNLDNKEYAAAFLQGQMAVTINPRNGTQIYQSIIPLESTSMSENLMQYFAQSEQISTKIWLVVQEDRAAGMLLQLMPGQDSSAREEFWEYALHLAYTVTEQELLTLDNETLLHRLYHETEIRLFDRKNIAFKCGCTAEKIQQVLHVLGKEEITQLLKEENAVSVQCDFCNQTYSFDSIDIALLFHTIGG